MISRPVFSVRRAGLAPSEAVARVAGGVAANVISRGLAARSVADAQSCILRLMESDGATSPVALALLRGATEAKKPKVPPECVSALLGAYKAFGAAPLPNKQILGALKTLLEVARNDDAQTCEITKI